MGFDSKYLPIVAINSMYREIILNKNYYFAVFCVNRFLMGMTCVEIDAW